MGDGEPTHTPGKGTKASGEHAGLGMPQPQWPPVRVWTGDANVRRYWIKQQQREGPYVSAGAPRGWVLRIRGVGFGRPPAEGPWLGRGRRSRSPETRRVGQAGRRTCRRGTQVRTGLPAPQPPAAQPARPRRRISEGPRSLRLRGSPPQTGGPAPTPQDRCGMWAAAASGPGPAAAAIAGRGQRETRGCAGRHFT